MKEELIQYFKITKAGECEGKIWLNGQDMD